MWTAVGCGSGNESADPGKPVVEDPPEAVQPPAEDSGTPDAGGNLPDAGGEIPDAGTPPVDGGSDPVPDAGTPDSGTPDSGTPDSGTPDAGEVVVTIPSSAGWEFYGRQQGGPRFVYGVSADQGGNVWVAGGEDGLFLMKKGDNTLRRFTLEDGLHPYGIMRDGVGGPPPGDKYLKVISVAGGPSGTVFVGYEGKPPQKGMPTCEDEWDQSYNAGREPIAAIYKSGDADKVTLKADGTLKVVHYDIHTGPNKVSREMRGREKLCTIHRIAYDPKTQSVWFGGNHGFARGDAEFDGNVPVACFDPRPYTDKDFWWDFSCNGLLEHVHPAISGAPAPGGSAPVLTDRYFGIAVAENGDVFFGGQLRSTRFRYGTNGGNYWRAQAETEDPPYSWNRFDIWEDKDRDEEWPYPTEADRVDDHISAMSVTSSGDVWVSSFFYGLARLSPNGTVQTKVMQDLINYTPAGNGKPAQAPSSAVAVDPQDGSVWVGAHWWGGMTRLKSGEVMKYGTNVFGSQLVNGSSVSDIQFDRSGGKRRVLVSFQGYTKKDGTVVPGIIGIYTGD